MYRDPERIREKVIKIRLSREEDALLEALADYTGDHKAALRRQLMLDAARALLAVEHAGEAPGAEGVRAGGARG